MATKLCWGVVVCFILHTTSASLGFFDPMFSDIAACENVCKNTYPLHTYDKAAHLSFCQRGCRLFSIIDFVNDCDDLNGTRSSCATACKEAHPVKGDQDACIMGCNNQLPFAATHKSKMMAEEQPLFDPIMSMQNMFDHMRSKLSSYVSTSWSVYVQGNGGRLVVVRSEPIVFVNNRRVSNNEDYKTSNYLETNLAIVDNSATPNLKHSQVHAVERETYVVPVETDDGQISDWLGCIARKTGLPRLMLSFAIFLSTVVMLWLCFTTAVTAPEQRVVPQKLSIYGDLEYLKDSDKAAFLSLLHPQDSAQASPLPIKVQVEKI